MTHTPVAEPTLAVQLADSSVPPSDLAVTAPKASGFTSLFSAAKALSGKQDTQPWHQKGNQSAHEKKIGPAPNGTRRSMGKR